MRASAQPPSNRLALETIMHRLQFQFTVCLRSLMVYYKSQVLRATQATSKLDSRNIADNSNADVTAYEYHLYKVLDLINSDRYQIAIQKSVRFTCVAITSCSLPAALHEDTLRIFYLL